MFVSSAHFLLPLVFFLANQPTPNPNARIPVYGHSWNCPPLSEDETILASKLPQIMVANIERKSCILKDTKGRPQFFIQRQPLYSPMRVWFNPYKQKTYVEADLGYSVVGMKTFQNDKNTMLQLPVVKQKTVEFSCSGFLSVSEIQRNIDRIKEIVDPPEVQDFKC